MPRLNMTLDAATLQSLNRNARSERVAVARFARELLKEALARRAILTRRQKLARDYRAARDDRDLARTLEELEAMQVDLLDGLEP